MFLEYHEIIFGYILFYWKSHTNIWRTKTAGIKPQPEVGFAFTRCDESCRFGIEDDSKFDIKFDVEFLAILTDYLFEYLV